MKYLLLPVLSVLLFRPAKAADKDSTVYYHLPDHVKAVQFFAEMHVKSITTSKKVFAGIKTDAVHLSLVSDHGKREVVFGFPDSARVIVTGLHVDAGEKGEMAYACNWAVNETCKLLIAVAADSTENFSVYSGYAWLAKEAKWKLIGSCKISGRSGPIQSPASYFTKTNKDSMQISIGQVWCQGQNGSWKNMNDDVRTVPVLNLYSHTDSIAQRQIDMQLIGQAIASGNADALENVEGVYFKMIREGSGKQVSVNDTVTVFYKLSILNDGSLVSDVKATPDTFSLKRLIKGWQIGVPLCKVGGKIKLVIPSDLGYSIRTRAAKIPPNSILVFEIEILEAKSPL